MGYESGSTSHDGRDDDDEDEEFEEAGGGSRLLGFMFGNVDNSGDLDIDYLDEDAKEHLGALADKLGPSLTEIDLSVKTPQTPSDAAEQDYDRKAEDAVDYEDIDEEYDGPEVQAATEEDFLLPRKNFLATELSISTLGNSTSVFDDENYDEDDEESEKQHGVLDSNGEVPAISSEDLQREDLVVLSQGEKLQDDSSSVDVSGDAVESESVDVDIVDSEEEQGSLEEASTEKNRAPLPILCIEDGMAILRFSEIFGIHKPLKKAEKGERKYLVPKEMYMSINTTEAVEEDEEAFLKCSFQDVSSIRQAQVIQEKNLGRSDDDFNSEMFGVVHGSGKSDLEDAERKDSCYRSELFKDDLSQILTAESNESNNPKFYPLEQLDWEDRIIWDNSPVLSNNTAESCEKSGSDVDTLDVSLDGLEADASCSSIQQPEIAFRNHTMLLEPFDSTNCLEPSNTSISESYSHPQLLRLESRFDPDTLNKTTVRKDGGSEEFLHNDVVRRFDKLALQNRDVFDESWLDNIIWEPQQCISKPKLILDLQDEQMLFEILDNKDGKHLQQHAGAMIISRSVKANAADTVDVHGHGGVSWGRFNISNDKFYSNRKSSQQLKSHMKKRTAHGLKVLHSIPALKLQTMKAKLSNKDIANFHRPRALWYPHNIEVVLREQEKLPKQGPMKIILKSLGGKGCKLHVDAEEIISSIKTKASKKLDFKLSEPVKIFYSGKELEDPKSLAAQNVRPNSLLHLVRTKVHLLPRAQKLPGENKSLRPPGAFKKKSDLSAKDGHIFLMEYCEERPLLLGNVGMGARLCTYYQKSTPGDQKGSSMRTENSGLGSVIVLDPADKSPFLGDIKPGCTQSSLETNMYRAPIYQQKVSSTDYLLVRSAKGKLSIRRIDRIDVVGQQEPHMEVIAPGSKGVQTYIMNRLLVYLYREFRAVEKRGLRPSVRADELSAQFPSLSEAFLRKRLKHCADLQRGSNGQLLWVMRRNFRIPLEEELRRMVTPENVCSYESMQAGLYRLKRLGITKLTQPTGLLSAMNQLPDEAIALAAASHIERELQITPWNLSSNFVACTNQDRENIERLEITGVGDPSGRGLGFSFVRITPKAPMSNAVVKKKAVVGKGTTVTGTDADLRRLSMDAAREVLLKFNVPEEQIEKQTRWHRIAMIRKLSSEQAATGVKVDPTTISKYARGQRMSFTQLQQQTREKCQEIWERQVQSLSAFDGEENESDSEANSDLDSFAGDLENLLDAEECEEVEDGGHASKHDATDGVKGLKMRRRPFQAQAEEEIEDEAAEAAELCRMLMDDEEADRKKKKKARALVEQVGRTLVPQSKFFSESIDLAKKTSNAFLKQSAQSDGQFLLKENLTRDQREDDIFSAKRNIPVKVKPKKKNDFEDLDIFKKKVKILGDGIKIIKEKKSARESFVCGACGQLGHMRTNKNCPKYGEDQETRTENNEPEKASGKPNSSDQTESSQQKFFPKKIIPKTATKIAVVDSHQDDKSSSKGKVLKVKCGMNDKPPDKLTPATSQNSDKPTTSEAEAGNKSVVKVSKITFSNRKTEEAHVEHKPSIVIRPPMEVERDQPRRKITIKRPKEVISMDDESQEGSTGTEYRKTKKIIELSGVGKHRGIESTHFADLAAVSRKSREDRRWFEEQEKRRIAEIQREERARRLHDEQTRALEEQERLAELRRYEEDIRREREEEERQKAKKKKKKNKRPDIRDDYLNDLPPRRNDRRIPDRAMKRRAAPEVGRYVAGYVPPTKRRRGGEVGLSNILENIVETLKERHEISFLFLKPVPKKEAPDYLKIIKRPMDLSTIREKVRKLEYKSREEFRHDVWQITFNAHKYNDGRNPGIPPLADQLLELCDFLLDQNADSLAEAEAGIEYGDS